MSQRERKRGREKLRRDSLKEAIERLQETLLVVDEGFRNEAQRRSSSMAMSATRTAKSLSNSEEHWSFTKVEIINQAIHTILSVTEQNRELQESISNQEESPTTKPHTPSQAKPSLAYHQGVGPVRVSAVASRSEDASEPQANPNNHDRERPQPRSDALSQGGSLSSIPIANTDSQKNIELSRKRPAQSGHPGSASSRHAGSEVSGAEASSIQEQERSLVNETASRLVEQAQSQNSMAALQAAMQQQATPNHATNLLAQHVLRQYAATTAQQATNDQLLSHRGYHDPAVLAALAEQSGVLPFQQQIYAPAPNVATSANLLYDSNHLQSLQQRAAELSHQQSLQRGAEVARIRSRAAAAAAQAQESDDEEEGS